MKKVKVNFLALTALLVAGGTMAFTAPAEQEWVFVGESESEIRMASAYSLEASSPTGCDTTKPLPCSITVDADTESELQDYLDTKNENQILQEANGRRN